MISEREKEGGKKGSEILSKRFSIAFCLSVAKAMYPFIKFNIKSALPTNPTPQDPCLY
jgi:hypothetical protein